MNFHEPKLKIVIPLLLLILLGALCAFAYKFIFAPVSRVAGEFLLEESSTLAGEHGSRGLASIGGKQLGDAPPESKKSNHFDPREEASPDDQRGSVAEYTSWYQSRGRETFGQTGGDADGGNAEANARMSQDPKAKSGDKAAGEEYTGGGVGFFGFGSSGSGTSASAEAAASGGATPANTAAQVQSRFAATASNGGTSFSSTGGGYRANVNIGAPLGRISGTTASGYRYQVNVSGQQ